MARCSYCKHKVTELTRFCPICGHPNPGMPPTPVIPDYLDYVLPREFMVPVMIVAAYFGWKSDVQGGLLIFGSLGAAVGLFIGFVVAFAITGKNYVESIESEKITRIVRIVINVFSLGFILWLFRG